MLIVMTVYYMFLNSTEENHFKYSQSDDLPKDH
jgi:hypothetical protein